MAGSVGKAIVFVAWKPQQIVNQSLTSNAGAAFDYGTPNAFLLHKSAQSMPSPRFLPLFASALALGLVAQSQAITITGTVRDFNDTHPDFESVLGYDPGIVGTTLGIDKKPVYAGLAGNPTTHGATAFDQWFRDTPGVNLSTSLSITLTDPDLNGIFTYDNGSFFPIDGLLFGNQGRGHNYHFTYELHTAFTYTGGETFSFMGDDDLWVFIDNKLAIDLGGVHGAMGAAVALDTLGLTVGGTYDLDLFFAERHTSASTFRIDTSLILVDAPVPDTASSGALVLLAFAGLFGLRRSIARR
jgi:fibro-slime domain-containing protein